MPNNNNVLICRMNHDEITKYIYHWADIVKDEAELLGFNVVELNNEHFDESRFRRMIEEYDPFLVFLNGHGSDYSVKGFDKETDVILRCKNDHLFKDRMVYALSCHTFSILGRSAFNKGCKCYIGYNHRFVFPFQDFDEDGVFEDEIAEPFMEISNEIMLSLLRGANPEEAYRNSQTLLQQHLNHWQKQISDDSYVVVKWLNFLKKTQRIIL